MPNCVQNRLSVSSSSFSPLAASRIPRKAVANAGLRCLDGTPWYACASAQTVQRTSVLNPERFLLTSNTCTLGGCLHPERNSDTAMHRKSAMNCAIVYYPELASSATRKVLLKAGCRGRCPAQSSVARNTSLTFFVHVSTVPRISVTRGKMARRHRASI